MGGSEDNINLSQDQKEHIGIPLGQGMNVDASAGFGRMQAFPQGMFGTDSMQSNFQNMGWNVQDQFNPMFQNMHNSMANGQWNMMPNMMGKLASNE